MAIVLTCECGKRLVAPEKAAGRKGRCPSCGKTLSIPDKAANVEQAEPREEDAIASESEDDAARRKVIIADANEGDVNQTAQMFEDHGYAVIWKGRDAGEVIDKVRELAPDLIVLNENLVGMKGFHVVRTLTDPANPKNEDVWRKLYVMTTDKMRGRDKQYALSLGIEIFVDKPIVPTHMFPRIERRLRKKTTV